MHHAPLARFSCFDGHRRLASGTLPEVALVLKRRQAAGSSEPLLLFDNDSGRTLDIDTRGSEEELLARITPPADTAPATIAPATAPARGRGRPKLGVVAREVTLLPRHWEWLGTQPGGASVALRKLVEEARRRRGDGDRLRQTAERAYHFMLAIAGDLPDFEEATRSLFAHDRRRFAELIAHWPADIRDHAIALAFDGEEADSAAP